MKPKALKRKCCVGYVRVSTDDQAMNGCSLESQEARIRAWAQAHDYNVLGIYRDEGISGGKLCNRPAAQQVIDKACQHRAALICYSLSRLCRSTREALEVGERLRRARADLVSLTENFDTTTPTGKLLYRLMAVLAEFERDLVGERTSAAMAHLRSQNRRISGRIPYGYDLDVDGQHLVKNPDEQAVIAKVKRWHESGRSTRTIARLLNEQRIRSKLGKASSHTQVFRVLHAA